MDSVSYILVVTTALDRHLKAKNVECTVPFNIHALSREGINVAGCARKMETRRGNNARNMD